jgi:hypothetical protein
MMAGLGGGSLVLSITGLWFPELVSGRGWIALAIVIFGNWRVTWNLFGALFFGFLDALQLSLQAVGDELPYQLLLALPYVLTINALVVTRSRSRAPLSLATPYHRGQRWHGIPSVGYLHLDHEPSSVREPPRHVLSRSRDKQRSGARRPIINLEPQPRPLLPLTRLVHSLPKERR